MKRSDGISLVVLIITMTVLIILSVLLINTGGTGLNRTKEAKIKVEKQTIEEAINKRFTNYLTNETRFPLIGATVSVEEASAVFGEDMTEQIDYIKKVDSFYLKQINVERIDPKNKYMVNYNTGEVIGPLEISE